MRILRHELDITGYQPVALPSGGYTLSVAQSRSNPDTLIDLWSLDDQVGLPHKVGIYIIGTGNPMPKELESNRCFLGTVVTPNGLVWHVFDGPVL